MPDPQPAGVRVYRFAGGNNDGLTEHDYPRAFYFEIASDGSLEIRGRDVSSPLAVHAPGSWSHAEQIGASSDG